MNIVFEISGGIGKNIIATVILELLRKKYKLNQTIPILNIIGGIQILMYILYPLSELMIMPMFNDLLGGLPVNSDSPKSLLGPLFRSNIIDVEEFDVYLLDGSYMGKVNFLRSQLEKNEMQYWIKDS